MIAAKVIHTHTHDRAGFQYFPYMRFSERTERRSERRGSLGWLGGRSTPSSCVAVVGGVEAEKRAENRAKRMRFCKDERLGRLRARFEVAAVFEKSFFSASCSCFLAHQGSSLWAKWQGADGCFPIVRCRHQKDIKMAHPFWPPCPLTAHGPTSALRKSVRKSKVPLGKS